jgi:hypothetical protein
MGITSSLQEDAIKQTQKRTVGKYDLKRRLVNKVAGIYGQMWLHRAVNREGDKIALSE